MERRSSKQRTAPRRRVRSGVAAVELAFVLLSFLILVLGMLDLGIGVFRYHLLCEAARHGARQAAVHGKLADKLGMWGPGNQSGDGDDESELAGAVRPFLAGLDPSEVTIEAQWPDGGNDPQSQHRVCVTVSAPYRPVVTFIFGNPTFTLKGTSMMYVAH